MSLEKTLRELVRDEVQRLVAPLAEAIEDLQAQGNIAARLAQALSGGALPASGGRKPVKLAKALRGTGRKPGRPPSAKRGCALAGCRRPSRSKGYCAAHYQKYRSLARQDRLPSDWKEGAAPGSVKDIILPRGRAGAKALADSRKKK